ncbi:restriction endonuclease [Bifidobacterium pullorum]|uniref:Restriction endonuclease n=1 Tax=Bifidobacterium pullorum subsp. gallinarum TaxID=78344 RepID=A0A921IZP9_9BIFI|nr:restriction endonuclease [Bifidobacterium pullorum]HJG41761.1 restriction endonuclease [Bifidobacterium pullorum subsp. gallinarum]
MLTWDQFMNPVLVFLSDGSIHSRREIYDAVAAATHLSDEDKSEITATGQLRYIGRIAWAITYLKQAEAISNPKRSHYVITQIGKTLLEHCPDGITQQDLKGLAGFDAFISRSRKTKASDMLLPSDPKRQETAVSESTLDPMEQIEHALAQMESAVVAELLERLRAQDPEFFENAVLKLLIAMGYGDTSRARHTGKPNDGGIDGIIDQDPLGLKRVYLQAKRYAATNTVGAQEVRAFVGAINGQQADSGVFITTSTYSSEARKFAEHTTPHIVLVDGEQLTSLMIKYGVGVQTKQQIRIVEIDEDFFE